jgi:hypothetical protein
VAAPDWKRTGRRDSHGQDLVRYVAELDLGPAYGPTRPVRLVAATDDPQQLKADATWYLATNLPSGEASPTQVDALYVLRDWIEHYYKPVKHELGWADFQIRSVEAIIRHWQLVMLAFTFSLLVGNTAPTHRAGEKSTPRIVWNETLRAVRRWLCPGARVGIYWQV